MKIYVLKASNLLKFFLLFLVLAAVLSFISIQGSGAIGVFTANKELPIYSVEYTDKKASITFDCAWGDGDIPDILQALKNENVKATFFIVGTWAERFPDTVKLIAKEGHDIANHSNTHLRMGVLDKSRIRTEISECGRILGDLAGKKIDLFRPPYGDYSNNVVSTARELGYYTIQWNVDSLDWKPGISQEEITGRIMKKIRPGSIILFHNDTPHTAKILPSIISSLKNDGYEFLPVSEMILKENYNIDFEGRQRKKE